MNLKSNYELSFASAQQSLYGEIDRIGRTVNPSVGCFHDGVAFPEKYLAAKKRVAWVLKNSYDDSDEAGNPVSDGMEISDWFSDEALEDALKKQIFIKMALATHCIQQNLLYSDAVACSKNDLKNALQSIALVDLSKLPGGKTISYKELRSEFSYFKDVVSKQIELYSPNVIIFGNTLHICREIFSDLDYRHPLDVYKNGDDCVLRSFFSNEKNRIYLEAYHPSYPVSYETFVGTISQATKKSR